MTTAVVGAGPVGTVLARALADRGEDVLVLDRDAGPGADGSWRRRGVMQFAHPHFFRFQVRQVLERHVPALWDEVLRAGCVVNDAPEGLPPHVTTVAARRSVFEAALRRGLQHERITFVPQHAERVLVDGGRVTGVVAGGQRYAADRVVVATGRSGSLGDDLRPAGESSPCGVSYVSRMYRARTPGEGLRSFTPLGAQYDGYLTIVFPQDDDTLSALVVRRSGDPAWAPLWRNECFDAAVASIPNLAPWTDPERFEPITDVMRGGTLVNAYRGQGTPPPGLHFVGDAVCTTNPAAGRGTALGLQQAAALLDALDEHADPRDVSAALDAWCETFLRPWHVDQVADDAMLARRYDGLPLDLDAPVCSELVVDAAEQDPSLQPLVQPYLGMVALPSSLEPAHDRVRELLREGWRPRPSDGPGKDELLERMSLVGAAP